MAETTEESLANFQQTTETDWHKSDFQVLHFQQNLTLMAEWAIYATTPSSFLIITTSPSQLLPTLLLKSSMLQIHQLYGNNWGVMLKV